MEIKINHKRYGKIILLIDDEDFYKIKNKTIYFNKKNCNYIYVSIYINKKSIALSRYLLNVRNNYFVDHINRNPLDNRKKNLRLCTNKENACNRNSSINGTSKFLGVSLCKRDMNWRAQITKNKKTYFLGRYDTQIEAALAYNKAALELHGEYANLNKIKGVII